MGEAGGPNPHLLKWVPEVGGEVGRRRQKVWTKMSFGVITSWDSGCWWTYPVTQVRGRSYVLRLTGWAQDAL